MTIISFIQSIPPPGGRRSERRNAHADWTDPTPNRDVALDTPGSRISWSSHQSLGHIDHPHPRAKRRPTNAAELSGAARGGTRRVALMVSDCHERRLLNPSSTLPIVERRRERGQISQQVIAALGSVVELQASGQLWRLLRAGATAPRSAPGLSFFAWPRGWAVKGHGPSDRADAGVRTAVGDHPVAVRSSVIFAGAGRHTCGLERAVVLHVASPVRERLRAGSGSPA
jgi:hypothetical protein